MDVTRLGDEAYELTLTTGETTEVVEGQRLLIPYAEDICGGKGVTFGHYKFETMEPVGPGTQSQTQLILHQQFQCGVLHALTSPRSAAPAVHDDKAIEQITYEYLTLKDTGKYSDAYALFTDGMKASTNLESWTDSARSFNAVAGKVGKRQIKQITWYDNPPSAPVPGIYAAADYSSEFDNLSFHCGYVVWLATAEGSYELVREEQNFIDNSSEAKMTPEQVSAFRSAYGC